MCKNRYLVSMSVAILSCLLVASVAGAKPGGGGGGKPGGGGGGNTTCDSNVAFPAFAYLKLRSDAGAIAADLALASRDGCREEVIVPEFPGENRRFLTMRFPADGGTGGVVIWKGDFLISESPATVWQTRLYRVQFTLDGAALTVSDPEAIMSFNRDFDPTTPEGECSSPHLGAMDLSADGRLAYIVEGTPACDSEGANKLNEVRIVDASLASEAMPICTTTGVTGCVPYTVAYGVSDRESAECTPGETVCYRPQWDGHHHGVIVWGPSAEQIYFRGSTYVENYVDRRAAVLRIPASCDNACSPELLLEQDGSIYPTDLLLVADTWLSDDGSDHLLAVQYYDGSTSSWEGQAWVGIVSANACAADPSTCYDAGPFRGEAYGFLPDGKLIGEGVTRKTGDSVVEYEAFGASKGSSTTIVKNGIQPDSGF